MGVKISALPSVSSATLNDLLEAVQSGVSVKITVQMLIDLASDLSSPAGTVVAFTTSKIPTGWLLANGAAVSKIQYPRLFAEIGYFYGGSGTYFNLPDLRGQFIRGFDNGKGVDPGRGLGSTQQGGIQSHQHDYVAIDYGGYGFVKTDGDSNGRTITASSGATGGTETRPINVALNYIIKT